MNWRSRSEPAPICCARWISFCAIGIVAGSNGRFPKLVKIRHGNSPMSHRTPRILFGHGLKCIFGGAVSEGVKQGHAAVELRPDRRSARNRKRHRSQFLGYAVAVWLLCRRERKDQEQAQQY